MTCNLSIGMEIWQPDGYFKNRIWENKYFRKPIHFTCVFVKWGWGRISENMKDVYTEPLWYWILHII